MLISKFDQTAPWAQVVAREATRPVFPTLPPAARPYVLAVTLFGTACALMYIGNAALLHYGLPWALVSLLVVVAAANLWGVRPAALVLSLSALYGVVVVPHLAPLSLPEPVFHQYVLLVRTLAFVTCGTAVIWLTARARQMQAKAERRREVVGALQSMILPGTLTQAPGYDLGGLSRPAHHEDEVGGDFYDFYPIEAGRYGLLIGDVMGKGKEAAASTALLRYSVRAFCSMGAHPAQIMRQLNTLIETQDLRFETASLFLGFLDIESGTLRYANAGHEPPMLRHADGAEEVLDATGPILGVGLEMTYEERSVVLSPHDALLLMTDGVTEARNAQGLFLDTGGAWRLFRAALGVPSSGSALALLASTLMVYIGATRCDDIALLLLRRTADPAAPRTLPHRGPCRTADPAAPRTLPHRGPCRSATFKL